MRLSIRIFGKVLSLILIVIFFTFIYFINELYNKIEEERTLKSTSYRMITKANELKDSSTYLTKFARQYAVTADPKYRDYYYKILDIRNGKVKRPQNYGNVYWDLREPLRSNMHPQTLAKSSLYDKMESLPYSEYQLEKLHTSHKNSDELVNLEIEAFNAVKNNNQKLAISLVYSPRYEKAKEKIMLPLDEFLKSLVSAHESKKHKLDSDINTLFSLIFILVVSGISVFFISLFILRKKVLVPIEYLSDTITRFKNGEEDFEKTIYCNDEIGLFTEQFFDMKEQRDRDYEAIHKLALTDSLTEVKNRRAFFDSSEKFFKLARRKELALSVILIDIDFFKKVNDTYGHIIGDEILKFLVKQTQKVLRDSDILARYGGEEFIVLLPDTDLEGAIKAAQKIRSTIEETPYQGDVEVSITISCGVAQLHHEKLLKDLIQKSDEALYRAKEFGRNRVEAGN